jgi:prophage DNA circulation protein
MSIATLANAAGSVGGVASAVGKLANLLTGGTDYASQVRTASFGGVPFAVLEIKASAGRKVAVHDYSFRDQVWVEDLGRNARRYTFTGFLVEDSLIYGGGGVIDQMMQLRAVCEMPGPQSFVHPTLGRGEPTCLGIEFTERWDLGRVIEFRMSLIISGKRIFPTVKNSTGSAVATAAASVKSASLLDYAKSIAAAVAKGAAVVQMAISTAIGWYQLANSVIHDVKNVFSAISNLSGSFGRLFGGGNNGYRKLAAVASAVTVGDLLSAAVVNRAAVASAGSALTAAAANVGSDASTFAAAAQSLAGTVSATTTDPAAAMQSLSVLAAYSPSVSTTSSAIGSAMATVQSATGALLRRSALASLAVAASAYQPTSSDDAVSVRQALTSLIDGEILTAGDAGDDNSYTALRTLRQAVVSDLDTRGAQLAAMSTFSLAAPLPALVVANRIYRDASRSDELVTQANPIHPAFMPTVFTALTK